MADLYGAIKDKAVNRLIRAMMAFRPDIFNYAAPSWVPIDKDKWFAGTKEIFLSCFQVGLARAADPNKSPRFTRIPYLPAPALGGNVADLGAKDQRLAEERERLRRAIANRQRKTSANGDEVVS